MRKALKKLLAVTMAFTLLFTSVAVLGNVAAAADIDFVWENGKRIGIKTIKLNDLTYFDLDSGRSTIDNNKISVIELYRKVLTSEYGGNSTAKAWANIATAIFKQAGTDHGFNDDGWSGNYDQEFTHGNGNKHVNVVDALSKSDVISKGDTGLYNENVRGTGFAYTNSLKSVQDALIGSVTAASGNHRQVSASEIIRNSTGNEDGFPLLNDEAKRDVIYNIVTCHNGDSLDNKWYYSSFGIAYYDFEVVPFANKDLAYITAAEGYDSIADAAADNVPGVTYNSTGKGSAYTSYTENKSKTESTVGLSYTETSSVSVSNSMESSKSYSFSESIESQTKFETTLPLIGKAEETIVLNFTAEQAISTAYGKEESVSSEVSTSTTSETTLPPHTKLGVTQRSGSSETILDYQCPVSFTYKVAIFAINGEAYADNAAISAWNTLGYDQGGMCLGFGSDSSVTGLTAVDNLYNRAVTYIDLSGYETTAGNTYGFWYAHGQNKPSVPYNEVPWKDIIGNTSTNGNGKTCKQNAVFLKGNRPLSMSGATMTMLSKSVNTDVSGILSLYDLDFVQIDGDAVHTLAPGGTLDLSRINTMGYNSEAVEYYGYIPDGGEWVLADADGDVLDSVDGAEVAEVSNYQTFTASKPGTYYVKFLIDETLYSSVDDNSVKITNADLSSTPMLKVNVTETGKDHTCSAGPWRRSARATCTEHGEEVCYCTVCGRLMDVRETDLLDHVPMTTTTPASCKHAGEKVIICAVCKKEISRQETPIEPHTPGKWEKISDATCERDGEMQQYCSVCGELLNSKVIPAHGHAAYWKTVEEATCVKYGRKEYVCSICSAVLKTERIEKEEHVPGKWEITKDCTCTEPGLKQQTCALCGALLGEPQVIEPHAHQLGAWVVIREADCERDGEKIQACTDCKGVINSEIIPALGHTAGVWATVLEATCVTDGEEHLTCTRCNIVIDSRRIAALGHKPGPAATCVDDQICLTCGEVLEKADDRSHTWSEWATSKEAGFFTERQERRFCTSCNKEEFRYVSGTAGCHKYFPHVDGDDCGACNTLHNINSFFRGIAKTFGFIIFGNIGTNILFPWLHKHFHHWFNPNK